VQAKIKCFTVCTVVELSQFSLKLNCGVLLVALQGELDEVRGHSCDNNNRYI